MIFYRNSQRLPPLILSSLVHTEFFSLNYASATLEPAIYLVLLIITVPFITHFYKRACVRKLITFELIQLGYALEKVRKLQVTVTINSGKWQGESRANIHC